MFICRYGVVNCTVCPRKDRTILNSAYLKSDEGRDWLRSDEGRQWQRGQERSKAVRNEKARARYAAKRDARLARERAEALEQVARIRTAYEPETLAIEPTLISIETAMRQASEVAERMSGQSTTFADLLSREFTPTDERTRYARDIPFNLQESVGSTQADKMRRNE